MDLWWDCRAARRGGLFFIGKFMIALHEADGTYIRVCHEISARRSYGCAPRSNGFPPRRFHGWVGGVAVGAFSLGKQMPNKERSPAFQFYPRDWFDYKVQRMSLEAQGAYFKLLCHMWTDSKDQCSIPNDILALKRIWGVEEDQVIGLLRQIQWPGDPCLIEGNDRLASVRLKKELSKQRKHRRAKSLAGKKGMAKRWQGHNGVITEPKSVITEHNSSSSSSSSSSTTKGKETQDVQQPGGWTIDTVVTLLRAEFNRCESWAEGVVRDALTRSGKTPKEFGGWLHANRKSVRGQDINYICDRFSPRKRVEAQRIRVEKEKGYDIK